MGALINPCLVLGVPRNSLLKWCPPSISGCMPFTHEKPQVKTVVSVLPHIFGQKK